MTDETEDALRAHFAEHDRVSQLALESAKALFGLRRLDEELVELVEESMAMRGDDDPDVWRFEHGDVVLVVQRRVDDVALMVSPPTTQVEVETAGGTLAVDTDEDGAATLAVTGPVRFRLHLPDGTWGVTDGVNLSPR